MIVDVRITIDGGGFVRSKVVDNKYYINILQTKQYFMHDMICCMHDICKSMKYRSCAIKDNFSSNAREAKQTSSLLSFLYLGDI